MKKDLLEAGYREFNGIMLIPLRLWDRIPQGTQLVSIHGDVAVKGKDEIDLDTRAGLLAWGFRVESSEL